MHANVFSIQIFQYFRQIPPRCCTLVLFIAIIYKYNFLLLYFYIIYHLLLLSPFSQRLVLSSWLLANILAHLVLHLQFSFLRGEGQMAVELEKILLAWRLVKYASLSLVSVP